MKYRKLPVEIDAWHWLFNPDQEMAPQWVTDALNAWPSTGSIKFEPDHLEGPRISIATLEGIMIARPGDYIIKDIANELYSCKQDIFEATYEEVK